jgi:D-amino-acid dehydrogenase
MTKDNSVLIVGAGIIGACSAYYLSEAGFKVTMVDKDLFASGSSHANCGFICPSHALPLCVPEALMKPIKSAFKSYSPFYVNPLAGPGLWGWLCRFALSCKPATALKSTTARHLLLQSSMELFKELIDKESIDCEFQQKGLLFAHVENKSLEHFSKTNDFLTKEFGLTAKHYDSQGIVNLEPALKNSVVGGWHYEGDAHLRPDKIMAELKRVLLGKGVNIIENCEVKEFITEGNTISAIDTSKGTMTFGKLLLSTGAMAPKLAKKLGVKLHIQPGKGYSLTTNRPKICPKIPMILEDHSVAVTPFKDGFRLGSTMEFGGYNTQINEKRLGLLEEGAQHYLRDVRGEEIQEKWYGWRPMTHNGIPIISQTNTYTNTYIAAGHSMLGLSMGPATGKLISEIISGDKPHIIPEAFQIS